jgi:hypothetical protein
MSYRLFGPATSGIYAAAERGSPGLGGDAKRLHQIVTLRQVRFCAGFTVADGGDRSVNFELGLRQFEPNEGREGVTVLANLTGLLEYNSRHWPAVQKCSWLENR